MGNFFTPDIDVKPQSLVSREQRALFGPLSEKFQELLGRDFGPEGALESFEGLFETSFLDPAIQGFNRTTRPQIEGGFANVGGTLSSRRGDTLARALTDVQLGSQSQFGQLLGQVLPAILGQQTGVLGQASQFALGQSLENLVVQEPSLGQKISSGLSLGQQAGETGKTFAGFGGG